MKTILNELRTEYTVKRSRFLGILFHIYSENDAAAYLGNLHSEFSDATHIVYAYRTAEGLYRISDANEPKNSAGKPVYNVLEKNQLFNVMICVIRYFGGIKLGIGGLVRAYSHTAAELVRAGDMKDLLKVQRIELTTGYQDADAFVRLCSNTEGIRIEKTEYGENVTFTCIVSEGNVSIAQDKGINADVRLMDEFYSSF